MKTSVKTPNWQTVSEIELIYRSKIKASDRPKIGSSADAYHILLQAWDPDKIEFVEQFNVLLLSRNNRVLGIYTISTGCTSGTVVDIRLIFAAALKANASGIIMAHNHPSGALKASQADKDITRKAREAGKFMDIPVLDHIIVTTEGYYSFADEGAL